MSRKMLAWAREALALAAFIVAAMAARSSLADHYVIPTGSMEPTLGIGDRVVVDKRAYGLRMPFTLRTVGEPREPVRGDVVVFESPADGETLIKRVVGVPGDTVEVRDGRVRIDGREQPWDVGATSCEELATHRHRLGLAYGGGDDQAPLKVPDGYAFVMGDNRGNSADSRVWGLLPLRNVLGRAVAVYWAGGQGFRWRRLSGDECPGEAGR